MTIQLSDAIVTMPSGRKNVKPETYRRKAIASVLSICVRTLDRMISSGNFPKPDIKIGKHPIWKRATVERWMDSGGVKTTG
jgi:predicted DNA-binding transcriptional regulator AlpA